MKRIALILLFSSFLIGQNMFPQRYKMKSANFDSSAYRGLKTNVIGDIAPQSDTLLWLGTGSGLAVLRDTSSIFTLASNKDIKEGAVFNETGIIGQVVNNQSFYEVMLLTDTKSSIPLTNSKENFYCNALGSGVSGYVTCSYNQLVWSDDHELGEKFFSSGLGGIYPKGIEIGNLESKKIIDPSTTLLKIKLTSNPLHSNLFGVIKL